MSVFFLTHSFRMSTWSCIKVNAPNKLSTFLIIQTRFSQIFMNVLQVTSKKGGCFNYILKSSLVLPDKTISEIFGFLNRFQKVSFLILHTSCDMQIKIIEFADWVIIFASSRVVLFIKRCLQVRTNH